MKTKDKIKVIIKFPGLFTSINLQHSRGKYGNVFLTDEARAYKEMVGWEARQAYKGKLIEGDVIVTAWYYFSNKRRKDALNDKLTWDALEGIIYKDDKQISDAHIHRRYDTDNPRTKIVITEK